MVWLQNVADNAFYYYVAFFFTAACASILFRNVSDRLDETTDRDRLVYHEITAIPVGSKDEPEVMFRVNFNNLASFPINVELLKFEINLAQRLPNNADRKTSRITLGAHSSGWFESTSISLKGLEGTTSDITIKVDLGFGKKSFKKRVLHIAMDGVCAFNEYEEKKQFYIKFWDSSHE